MNTKLRSPGMSACARPSSAPSKTNKRNKQTYTHAYMNKHIYTYISKQDRARKTMEVWLIQLPYEDPRKKRKPEIIV